jgi:hypothetical protein
MFLRTLTGCGTAAISNRYTFKVVRFNRRTDSVARVIGVRTIMQQRTIRQASEDTYMKMLAIGFTSRSVTRAVKVFRQVCTHNVTSVCFRYAYEVRRYNTSYVTVRVAGIAQRYMQRALPDSHAADLDMFNFIQCGYRRIRIAPVIKKS